MQLDNWLGVTLVLAIAAVYFPVFYFLSRNLQRDISLNAFVKAVFLIGKELSDKDDWVSTAIERLEAIYQQSDLSRSFASVLEVVEHLHYLAYTPRLMFIGFQSRFRRHEQNRVAFLEIRTELAVRDQPYSALRGDARMLVEAVNANLDTTAAGGKVALKALADYMKGLDKQVSRQRRLNIVFGIASVIGAVVAIIALTFQLLDVTLLRGN